MSIIIYLLLWALILGSLFFYRITLYKSLLIIYLILGLSWLLEATSILNHILISILIVTGTFLLLAGPFRKKFITKIFFNILKHNLPKISKTEQEALNAGTVWFDAELFSGKPNFKKFLSIKKPQLSQEEGNFITTKVNTLCSMINDWEIEQNNNLPDKIWDYLKKEKFFGIIIDKKYGGLEFSALAHSEIIKTITAVSMDVAVSIMVPNSLGPAELLKKYGTEKQKQFYLPKLAIGEEIPCFGLTNQYAGSDATAIPDKGIVCKQKYNNKETIGILLNWDKRYITLAPIATIIGLAFKAYDPDHLLSSQEDLGITCALIPVKTKGVETGRRHKPLTANFLNGPTTGKDVFIPLDYIIGGEKMLGQGWKMLVECLSVGRAISLPSSAAGSMQLAAFTSGAYAQIRTQFKQQIGNFEGIKEPLARIAAYTYMADSACKTTIASIDCGEKPSILGAILKYHLTELGRKVMTDAMDLHAGKGIICGPKNYLAKHYINSAIGITVEGANILTRNLIIFGQGAIRCHPYLQQELAALLESDPKKSLDQFDLSFIKHIGYFKSNLVRSIVFAIISPDLKHKTQTPDKQINSYISSLNRASSSFALLSDLALMILGGKLKFKEFLSARLGDLLSNLYLASTVIKRFNDEGKQPEILPIIDYLIHDLLYNFWQTYLDLLDNFPNKAIANLIKIFILPFGNPIKKPNNNLVNKVADLLQNPGVVRDIITNNIYISDNNTSNIEKLHNALNLLTEVEPIIKIINKAIKSGELPDSPIIALLDKAFNKNLITEQEKKVAHEYFRIADQIISVDSF